MTGQSQKSAYAAKNPIEPPFTLTLKIRNKWVVDQLRNAGVKGCTPIENPTPRWSAYIQNLRNFGVKMQIVVEQHDGKFAGNHARNVLLVEAAIVFAGGA